MAAIPHNRISDEQRARVRKLRAEGMTYRQLQAATGYNRTTCHAICQEKPRATASAPKK